MPILQHGEGEAETRILVGLRFAVQLSVAILVLEPSVPSSLVVFR